MMHSSSLDIWAAIFRSIGFVFLYMIVGFGPGFILGLIAANQLLARHQPTYMETHRENIKRAIEHNKQWRPDHERWKK